MVGVLKINAVRFASGRLATEVIRAIYNGYNEAGAHSNPEKRLYKQFPVKKKMQIAVVINKMLRLGIITKEGIANNWRYVIDWKRIDLVALIKEKL